MAGDAAGTGTTATCQSAPSGRAAATTPESKAAGSPQTTWPGEPSASTVLTAATAGVRPAEPAADAR